MGGRCGLGVSYRGDDGLSYVACHGSDGGLVVGAGDRVSAGQVIMHSSWTGNVQPPGPAGTHLHQGVHRNGVQVCPQPMFAAIYDGRAVDIAALPGLGMLVLMDHQPEPPDRGPDDPTNLAGYRVPDTSPPDPICHVAVGEAVAPISGCRVIVRTGRGGGWRGDLRIVSEPESGSVLLADEGDWYRAFEKPEHPVAVEASSVMVEVARPARGDPPGEGVARWAARVGRAAQEVWKPWTERHPVPAREWPWLPGARVALTGGRDPVQRDIRAVSEPILGSDGAVVVRVILEAGYHRWWELLPVMTWPIEHVWVE